MEKVCGWHFCHPGLPIQGQNPTTHKPYRQGYKVQSRRHQTDEAMLLLDIIVTPTTEGTLTTGVYRKPTHIAEYIQWDNHH